MAISIISNILTELIGKIRGKTGSFSSNMTDSKSIMNLLTGHYTYKLDSSIAKMARRNIAQFPMICSDAIPSEQVFKLGSKMEGNIAQMLLLCIQNGSDTLDLSKDPDAKANFIKAFTAGSNNGSGLVNITGSESGIDGSLLLELGSESGFFTKDEFQKAGHNSLMVANIPIKETFEMSLLYNKNLSLLENGELDLGAVAPVSGPYINGPDEGDPEGEDELGNEGLSGAKYSPAASTKINGAAPSPKVDVSASGEPAKKTTAKASGPLGTITAPSASKEDESKRISIEKKGDELPPTIVTAEIILLKGDSHIKTTVAFGVKTMLHVVSSSELIEAVKDTYAESSLLVRLIRWKSGEMSFIRDVLMNMKEIKQTVRARNNRYGGVGPKAIFANLRFKVKSAIAMDAAFSKDGKMLPTAIVVLTMDEVDMIKRSCGKDLINRMQDSRELCEKLALFGIVVVDPVNEVFYTFFDDGVASYTQESLKSKDDKKDDGVVRAIFGALKR